MREFCNKTAHFVVGVFSDNGSPSSSRVLTFLLAVFSCTLIWGIFHYLKGVHDPMLVASWMGNMPMVIGGLAALVSVPYGLNQGGNAVSNIMNVIAAVKNKL